MLDFIKLHIQDNSIYMDNGFNSGEYETSKIELVQSYKVINEETGESVPDSVTVSENGVAFNVAVVEPRKPYKLTVNLDKNNSKVKVRGGDGTEVNVVKADASGNKMYNIQAREYWLDNNNSKITCFFKDSFYGNIIFQTFDCKIYRFRNVSFITIRI